MSEPVMYIIVNSSLPMKKGKLCAQVGHAVIKSYVASKHMVPELFAKWDNGSSAKVVLKATEEDLIRISETNVDISFRTIDEGRTQIERNSFTALSFILHTADKRPKVLKTLKLL